jgi:hypothetical protein
VRDQLRLAAAAPGLAQFLGYRQSWLRGDVMAGLTVATYLVPQAMAYATVAGLSPVAGVWASLLPAMSAETQAMLRACAARAEALRAEGKVCGELGPSPDDMPPKN